MLMLGERGIGAWQAWGTGQALEPGPGFNACSAANSLCDLGLLALTPYASSILTTQLRAMMITQLPLRAVTVGLVHARTDVHISGHVLPASALGAGGGSRCRHKRASLLLLHGGRELRSLPYHFLILLF